MKSYERNGGDKRYREMELPALTAHIELADQMIAIVAEHPGAVLADLGNVDAMRARLAELHREVEMEAKLAQVESMAAGPQPPPPVPLLPERCRELLANARHEVANDNAGTNSVDRAGIVGPGADASGADGDPGLQRVERAAA